MADEKEDQKDKPSAFTPPTPAVKKPEPPKHMYNIGDTVDIRATVKSVSGDKLVLVTTHPESGDEIDVGSLPYHVVKLSSVSTRIGAAPKNFNPVKEVPSKTGGVKLEAA